MTAVQDRPVDLGHGTTITLELCDELDGGVVPRLREQLQEALDLRPEALVVDLAHCRFLGAQVLVPLLEAHRAARQRQVPFRLQGLQPQAHRLIALAGLAGVFEVREAA